MPAANYTSGRDAGRGSVTTRKASSKSGQGTGSVTARDGGGGGSIWDAVTNRVMDEQRRLAQLNAQRQGQPFAAQQVERQVGASVPRGMSGGGVVADVTGDLSTTEQLTAASGGGPGMAGDQAASEPLTGFASRFTPEGAGLLQNEPAALLAETLRAMGLSPNGGYYGLTEPLAQDMNQLYMLFNSGAPNSVGTLSDVLNFGNQLFTDYLTPGGPQVSYGGGLEQLFGAAGNSPLGLFLGGGAGEDPQAQVRNFMSLYGALVGNSTPLIQQGALMNYANLAARDYINSIAQGNMSGGNFVDYFNARQPFQGY